MAREEEVAEKGREPVRELTVTQNFGYKISNYSARVTVIVVNWLFKKVS